MLGSDYETYLQSVVSFGVNFLYEVLHIEEYEELRDVIADKIACTTHTLMDVVIYGYYSTDERFLLFPAEDKYDAWDSEKTVPLLPQIEQPGQVWWTRWYDENDDFYCAVPYEMDNDRSVADLEECIWGYALWDEARLDQWQVPSLSKPDGYSQHGFNGYSSRSCRETYLS